LISHLLPNGDILLNMYVQTVSLLMYVIQENVYRIRI